MRVLNFILPILFLLLPSPTSSLGEVPSIRLEYNTPSYTYNTVIYLDWRLSGSAYWVDNGTYYTYNDFSYMVTRSTQPMGGYYYYDFWLFSQSYYWDGINANYTSTNIKNVYVYVNGVLVTYDKSPLGITFFDEVAPTVLRVMSTSKTPKIIISWEKMSAI